MSKRWATVLGLSLATIATTSGSCTPDYNRRDADMQVNKILKDREQRTLDYKPQVQATTQTSAKPTTQAFAKIPVTRLPPPATLPILPSQAEVPYGPVGPQDTWPKGIRLPEDAGDASSTASSAGGANRLVYGPPAPMPAGQRLDLFKSIGYAVQHSRTYQDHMEDLYLAALDVTLQRHLFDPRPFARAGVKYSGDQVDYRSAMTVTNTVGVKQQLPYGGEITAQGLVDFVQALNDNSNNGESAQATLSASIPLLRGAGMVNLEALIQSEREIIYEVRAFETYRRQFVVDIASRYYRLLTELQSINNRRMNYASRIALTERTQALYAAGRLRFDEVQRSLQAQLQAENDLANVTDQYQGSLDDFKLLIGMPVEEDMEIIPIELKLQVPSTDSHQVVELAQKYRLDLQTSKDRIDDARRKVNVAKNGLLPDLDFEANTAVGNFKDTPAGHLNARTQTYDAGFTLDLPIDRVSERNAYRKSLIELERADRGFLTSRDQIIADVRDAIRGIRQAQTTLEIQRRGIELAQRRLEYNNELLLQGKTDARSVADAQDDLLRAQDSFDQATSNLQVAILQYLRDTGTLRVDPNAGALGQAMDRAALQGKRLDRAALDANDLLPAR